MSSKNKLTENGITEIGENKWALEIGIHCDLVVTFENDFDCLDLQEVTEMLREEQQTTDEVAIIKGSDRVIYIHNN